MFDGIWAFLSDSGNQATLTWLGGGAVVLAGGGWTVFRYFWKSSDKKSDRQKPDSQTPEGPVHETLIEGDGNSIGNTITVDKSTRNTNIHRTGLSGFEIALVGLVLIGAVLLGGAITGSRISANNGSLAAGGDITGNEIVIQGSGGDGK